MYYQNKTNKALVDVVKEDTNEIQYRYHNSNIIITTLKEDFHNRFAIVEAFALPGMVLMPTNDGIRFLAPSKEAIFNQQELQLMINWIQKQFVNGGSDESR